MTADRSQLDLFSAPPPRPLTPAIPRRERTLSQARESFDFELREEHHAACPCCDRAAHVAKRSLSSVMVRYLAEMYRAWSGGASWVDVTTLDAYTSGLQRGDYAYLRHWGLAETSTNAQADVASGLWRPTQRGIAFLRGDVSVPRHVWTFANGVFRQLDEGGFAAETVDVHEALGTRFDYAALMGME